MYVQIRQHDCYLFTFLRPIILWIWLSWFVYISWDREHMWPTTTKPAVSRQNTFWDTDQINMSQINRKQNDFQKKYWFFKSEIFSKYEKYHQLRASAFLAPTNLRNYFYNTYSWFCWNRSHMYIICIIMSTCLCCSLKTSEYTGT